MPRTVRKALNQALFREVNERIADVAADLEVSAEAQSFVCECHRVGCTDRVEIPVRAYDEIRADPSSFLVLPGHQDPGHEDVIADHGSYLIVRNQPGVAESIARETARTPGDRPADAR